MAFVKVATLNELAEGAFISVEHDGEPLALYCVEGTVYATRDACTHDGGTLSGGTLSGTVICCPRHGAKFDITSGAVLALPAFEPLQTYEVRQEGNDVYVDLES